MATKTLDTRGYRVPMPLVMISLSLEEMDSGDVLEVVVDDKPSLDGLPTWCQDFEHRLLESKTESDTVHRIRIQKK